MPILLPSWVESCWEEGLQKVVYATDPEMVSPVYHRSETSLTQFLFLLLSFFLGTSSTPLLLFSFPPSPLLFSPSSLLPQLSLHHCPPFSGCTISVTGLDEKTRMRVSKLTEEHGGTYSGELTKDVCTHLLVGNTSSE